MKGIIKIKSSFIILLIIAISSIPVSAQGKPEDKQEYTPQQVFQAIIKSYQNLNDYTVKIEAKVMIPDFRIPDFAAVLYFKKPDKFHIETKSFAPIPRNSGLFDPFQFDPEKNRVTFKQNVNLEGMQAELYRVEPGESETRVRFYNVWIGGNPKRILQVENHSFKGTKALVKLTYKNVRQGTENWLMPETANVHLTFPEGMQGNDNSSFLIKDNPVSAGRMRPDQIQGEGDIYISYSNWQINTGLDDSLF
jgi:outer membrane lipoprotein-sorting protein